MLDEEAAREIIADLEKQDEQRKAEEERKEIESLHAPGQVVDLPTPREEKRPDKAEFVSEHDSTVERQTKKYGRFEDKARQGDATRVGVGDAAADAVGRRPDGDAHAGPRQVPARRRDAGAVGARRAPGRRLRRAQHRPPRAGRAVPELGADVQPKPGGGGTRGGTGPC